MFNFKVPVFKDFKPKLIIFLVILLFILITISITWTPSVDYYSVKYRNSILNFIIFFLVIFSKNRISTYINLFLIIGTILSSIFLLIIHPNIYSNELYYLVRSNNLMCSLITGVNILFLTISKNQLFFKKRTLNLLLILNIILVFVSSSRGAIIAVLIVLIVSIINKKTLKE